jgi:hypothetical protein
VARWFEPFHVRQAQVARGELSAQVAAGADIVVAPAWLTHRRALEGVGESRRARAWTAAAVRLAREAVEGGLERRQADASTAGPVLVAGPLPDVSAGPEQATGRLAPAAAADELDTHDQAGILADVGVDLLLLERRSSFDAMLQATRIAVPAGRPVWATLPLVDGPGEPPLVERVAMLAAAGAHTVLVAAPETTDSPGVTGLLAGAMLPGGPALGVAADEPPLAASDADLDAWLEAGVEVLGLLSGATPGAMRPLVDARERLIAGVRDRAAAERSALASWVTDAARRAPGGRALWLGGLAVDPPPGFEWTVLDSTDASTIAELPDEAFRLVIAIADAAPEQLARAVEQGGIVALETGDDGDRPGRLAALGLRVQELIPAPEGRIRVTCRREA